MGNARRLGTHVVWAVPLSLAATQGIATTAFAVASSLLGPMLLSLPGGTEMFHFPPCRLRQKADARALPLAGFPIRESPDHSPLPAPRGLSQVATPFLASRRQGIHHVPLVA